jgi:hypothetical protein
MKREKKLQGASKKDLYLLLFFIILYTLDKFQYITTCFLKFCLKIALIYIWTLHNYLSFILLL